VLFWSEMVRVRPAITVVISALVLVSTSCRRDDGIGPDPDQTLPIASYFTTNDEGWSIVGDGVLYHAPQGGNPSGWIFAIDRTEGELFYFSAPARFLGDLADAYGLVLSFDRVWSETSPSNLKDGDDIVLKGNVHTLVVRFDDPPGHTWTPSAVRLDISGGWLHEATREPATAAEIQAVLGSLQQLLIRGEFRIGPEQGGLDNVVLGAEG
jgi:hypothetical protein